MVIEIAVMDQIPSKLYSQACLAMKFNGIRKKSSVRSEKYCLAMKFYSQACLAMKSSLMWSWSYIEGLNLQIAAPLSPCQHHSAPLDLMWLLSSATPISWLNRR